MSQTVCSRVAQHYDLPVEFYSYLGKALNYSCPIYEEGMTYEEAVMNKYKVYSQLLKLEPGLSVCEFGFGWGSLGDYMAKNYGVDYTGYNVTYEQWKYAKENFGLNYIHDDLYNAQGKFDRIISDGCLVHQRNKQGKFFAKCRELIKPNGMMLHKEMHITNKGAINLERCLALNNTFGNTGEYRTLEEDLAELIQLGFKNHVISIPIDNYQKAMDEWIRHMKLNAEYMKQIDEDKYLLDLATWRLYQMMFKEGLFRVDIMVSNYA